MTREVTRALQSGDMPDVLRQITPRLGSRAEAGPHSSPCAAPGQPQEATAGCRNAGRCILEVQLTEAADGTGGRGWGEKEESLSGFGLKQLSKAH